ncbi:hypothetical protein E6C70_07970 [Glaciibacter flavus]|uniref:YitT family protein n=1 Tax=Orlajensenia flava TaxID=2565934 RepID=A0A4S4FVZ4_9MICO|nr:hypothetical protein [Glaciibacter flavus]THG34222.1 hypothetical protein E6C70_07970 [Glaciibacter flavus]
MPQNRPVDRRLIRRSLQLLVGLFLYGIAIALIVRGGIGAAPWDVLTQGIALHTGLSFGLITVITSGVVLLLWIPLKQWPGVGTVLNALLVGPSADLGLTLIPADLPLAARIGLFVAGLVLLAVATGLYIGGHLGPGPRDGLMTGIHRRFGVRIWIARTAIEVVVVIAGWLLGGNVGLGTLVFALAIGPRCQFFIPRLSVRMPPRATEGTDAGTPVGPELEGSVDPSEPTIDSPAG